MKTSLFVAGCFWLFAFLDLLVLGLFGFAWARTEAYEVISLLIYAGVIFGWFLADSRERGVETSLWLKIAVVAIAVLAVPYYKFRYLGARAGLVFIAIVFLNLALLVAASAALDLIVFGMPIL